MHNLQICGRRLLLYIFSLQDIPLKESISLDYHLKIGEAEGTCLPLEKRV